MMQPTKGKAFDVGVDAYIDPNNINLKNKGEIKCQEEEEKKR